MRPWVRKTNDNVDKIAFTMDAMRQPLIFVLVGLFLAFVASDAAAHAGRHGASPSIDRSLDPLDADGEEGSKVPGSDFDCCYACFSAGLPNPAGSALGIDLLTTLAQAGFDQNLTQGLSRAPPDRPPRPA